MRPIRFVKYYEKGSTVLGGDQIAEELARRGLDALSLPVTRAISSRDALLIFIKTSRLDHLLAARSRGNRTVLDVQDTPVFKRRLKNGWLYDGGGIDLWNEVYAPFGMVAMPCGNTGVQMTGWFKKEIKSVADFKGLKMRIPGLAGKVYASLGVDVKLLPGGEIFPALERGVIDAAEFVGPYQDRRLGLHKAAKFYYTTGWHETATVSELLAELAKARK